MADGDGRNNGLIQPMLPASCQSPTTSASAIQPEYLPARGAKPAPRNATGRASALESSCGARSSMLDLALGFGSLLPDQRPQFALQRQQSFAGMNVAALTTRHGDADDLADSAGPPRHHHNTVGDPDRLL